VLAHELSRIKQGDVGPATVAVTTAGLLAGPLPGLHRALLDRVLGDRAEVLADVAAVEMTRYPPGLIGALESLGATGTQVGASAPALDHLWVVPAARADAGSTQFTLDERIDTLRER